MEAEAGTLCLVLHAHLPFVRHPEQELFLEEDWFFQAIFDSYLPLLDLCQRLADEEVPFALAISISPTLAAMLADSLLQARFLRFLEKRIELSALEVERTRWLPDLNPLARRYQEDFLRAREAFVDQHRSDLLSAFRRLEEAGHLELFTCGATHGYFPLMLGKKNLWRAQVEVAVAEHVRHFGRPPRGFWLPECGYEPGVDRVLKEAGIDYFFLDAHGVLLASPRPRYGVHAPVLTPSGVVAFARDSEASQQVWSADRGYPTDPVYRDFHHDAAWTLDYEYLRPYLHQDGLRTPLGLKYYSISGRTDEKEPYRLEQARNRATDHARHFLEERAAQVGRLRRELGRSPLIVAPFDAELFGHWWYEGPWWLESLIRAISTQPTPIQLIKPSEAVARWLAPESAEPTMSSWGSGGYSSFWLDDSNQWIYPPLHRAGERMVELANRFSRRANGDPWRGRALRQAARELLLAQSSDWAFLLKSGSHASYAERRVREHLGWFDRLYQSLISGRLEGPWLAELEERHNLFPEINPQVFEDRE